MRRRGLFKLGLQQRRMIYGYGFYMPFIIGFIAFYLYPFIQSMIYSVSKLTITQGGVDLEYVGLQNFHYALFVDLNYVRQFAETFLRVVSDVPLIILFSSFAAILLNQRFRGRVAARVVFFLPVIMGAGVVRELESTDYLTDILQAMGSKLGATEALSAVLLQLRLPPELLLYVASGVERIGDIIRSSGIQVLIFLAGLQSIPPSLYESSSIDGATGWEDFWKITFPLMTPLILTNVVYTIIDSFTSPANTLRTFIQQATFGGTGFGVGTAMAWLYFLGIFLILMLAIGIISRGVYYQE